MTEELIIDIDRYKMHVIVNYLPAMDPEIKSIRFKPDMIVADMEFSCDITISPAHKDVGDIVLDYLHYAHVGGWHIEEEIEKAI